MVVETPPAVVRLSMAALAKNLEIENGLLIFPWNGEEALVQLRRALDLRADSIYSGSIVHAGRHAVR
jgi:hypothetical protein